MAGVVYGHGGGLTARFIGAPARAGAAHYIAGGENRWAVVHVEDIAELYVAALEARAGGVCVVGDDNESPTMRQSSEGFSVAGGQRGTAGSITVEQARAEFGAL